MNIDENIRTFKNVLLLRSLSDSTRQSYILWAARFLEYLDITKASEKDYLQAAQNFLIAVNSFYEPKTYNVANVAVKYLLGAVLHIPVSKWMLPYSKSKKSPVIGFEPEQIQVIFSKKCDLRLKACMTLAYDCGMRCSEIVQLQFRDIRKEARTLRIENTKKQKTRVIHYSVYTQKVLNEYCRVYGLIGKSPQDYVFPSPNRKKPEDHYSSRALSIAFTNHLQDLPFYIPHKHVFHSLRHSFATTMTEMKCSAYVLKQMMGHTSLYTTSTYIHLRETEEINTMNPCDGWEDTKNDNSRK